MPLPKAFHLRTASIYSTMVSRFAEKRNKDGRLRQAGRLLPFDLEHLRAWVLEQLGGKSDGCALCYYCRRPLCSQDFYLDHKVPASRAGSLGLDNLAMSCDDCNRSKGGLTDDEFLHLRNGLDEMLHSGKLLPDGYKDVWARLRGQNIKLDAWRRGKKKAGETPPPPGVQLPLEEPF
jgi:hypothetical protein